MPELPDITLYLEALERRVLGRRLVKATVLSPFLLRTATPPLPGANGRKVIALRRLGKRIAFGLEGDFWLVLHLMIAGRLHWVDSPVSPETRPTPRRRPGKSGQGKNSLATFDFSTGTLVLTEAGTKRRASLHVVQGQASLQSLDPGGLEVLDCALTDFAQVLASQNHTLKRALTDPHLFSGIGNAYSDEILHRARISPVALSQKLSPDQVQRLFAAVRETIGSWIQRLRQQTGGAFPENVTAFRPEMAVHGKFGQPCPVCGAKVQRIRYADNETNYCPTCQTGGKLLADRSLSLLLKRDWPKTAEELEEMRSGRSTPSERDPAP
ncbi:MAG TPA: DNA-formamidopyrimidine glycosylase family protein [Verrucomicrobiae bacterium]